MKAEGNSSKVKQKIRKNCFTIAIAGASGAGKTLLVKKVAELLENSDKLYYDDYRPNYANLTKDLQSLRKGESITYPRNKRIIPPQKFLVIEEPTGRNRPGMAENIDFLVYIDTPLEVCLVRVLLRSIYKSSDEEIREFYNIIGPQFENESEEPPTKLMHIIVWLLEMYLKQHRQEYVDAHEGFIKEADLVVDGMKPIDTLGKEVVEKVLELMGN